MSCSAKTGPKTLIWKAMIVAALAFSFATPGNTSGRTDAAHLHPGSETRPIPGWQQFCAANPMDCEPFERAWEDISPTDLQLKVLDQVNRAVNRSVSPITDQEQFGVPELWTYPTSGRGDCEDFALEKRRRLLQLGWPGSALLMTVVVNRNGEGHAVLTVLTRRGEYILDNLEERVLPWSQTGLTFIKRQASSNPNRWESLNGVIGRPDVMTATAH